MYIKLSYITHQDGFFFTRNLVHLEKKGRILEVIRTESKDRNSYTTRDIFIIYSIFSILP